MPSPITLPGRRARDELLGHVDREVRDAVDAGVGDQLDRARPAHEQVDHVVRLVEQDRGLAPRPLLAAPVGELVRDDRIDVGADLRVAQQLDGVARGVEQLLEVAGRHGVLSFAVRALRPARPALLGSAKRGGGRAVARARSARASSCARCHSPGLEQLVEREDVKARDVRALGRRPPERASHRACRLSILWTAAHGSHAACAGTPVTGRPRSAPTAPAAWCATPCPGMPISDRQRHAQAPLAGDPATQRVGVEAHLRGHVVGVPALVGQRLRRAPPSAIAGWPSGYPAMPIVRGRCGWVATTS